MLKRIEDGIGPGGIVRQVIGLPFSQVQDELVEGVAHPLLGEQEPQPFQVSGPAHVHLDPPGLDGVVRVGLPVGVRVAVDDVLRHVDVGSDAAHPRPDEVVVDEVAIVVPEELPRGAERPRTVHVEDARGGLPDGDRASEVGWGLQEIRYPAEVTRTYGAVGVDTHQVGGKAPVLPVLRPIDENPIAPQGVPLPDLCL